MPTDKTKPVGHGYTAVKTVPEPKKSGVTYRISNASPIFMRYIIKTSDFVNKSKFTVTRKLKQLNIEVATSFSMRDQLVTVQVTELATGEVKKLEMKMKKVKLIIAVL